MLRVKSKKLMIISGLTLKICLKFTTVNSEQNRIIELTDVLDFFCINFRFEWRVFEHCKKFSNLFLPSIQIKKMLSIYPNHTHCFMSSASRNSLSTLSIKIHA